MPVGSRRDLYAWIEDGAAIYVCGDANAMAKDVHAALIRVLADQGRQERRLQSGTGHVRREGRYLRDVY